MKSKPWLAPALIWTSLFAHSSQSETLNPIEIYTRCYTRMVRQVPNEADPLFVGVKSGTKTAIDACIELFDRAKFSPAGVLQNRTSGEAKSILRTFHNLHRTWFQSPIHVNPAAGDLIRDAEEAPLYFTRAAFLPEAKFSSVVTHGAGLSGVRDQKKYPNEENPFLAQRIVSYQNDYPYKNETDLLLIYSKTTLENNSFVSKGVDVMRIKPSQITEVGDLVGVKASQSLKLSSFRPTIRNAGGAADVTEAQKAMLLNFESNGHFGGGILGSQAFLQNNANLINGTLANGFSDINRRLAARVFEDLLCHQLPTLTTEDVSPEVDTNSDYAFHKQSTCMQCHSSIDGLAFGFRNLFLFTSGPNPNLNSQNMGLNFFGFARLPSSTSATTFALKTPQGRLNYRERHSKRKITANFSTLAELGSKLAAGQDLYTCAAKRYYQFFTGVNVDLNLIPTKNLDLRHRNQVLKLGNDFKQSQSVRTLLKAIFASPSFQESNYLTEEDL